MVAQRNTFIELMFMHTNWHRSFKLTQSRLKASGCYLFLFITSSHRATLLEKSIRMQKGDEENSVHMVYSHVEPIKGTLLYSKRAFNLSLFLVSPYISFILFVACVDIVCIYCYSWWYGNFDIFWVCVRVWSYTNTHIPFPSLFPFVSVSMCNFPCIRSLDLQKFLSV